MLTMKLHTVVLWPSEHTLSTMKLFAIVWFGLIALACGMPQRQLGSIAGNAAGAIASVGGAFLGNYLLLTISIRFFQ